MVSDNLLGYILDFHTKKYIFNTLVLVEDIDIENYAFSRKVRCGKLFEGEKSPF